MRELELWIQQIFKRVGRAASGWRFNILNGVPSAAVVDKGYGYVQFIDGIDIDLDPEADPLAIGGTWGGAFIDDSGEGLLLGSTSATVIKTRLGDVTLLADGGDLRLQTNGGDVVVELKTSGDTFAVNDHLSSAIVTVTG